MLISVITVEIVGIALGLWALWLGSTQTDRANRVKSPGRANATELSFPQKRKACPEISGYCLGFRHGDVDGDGRDDVVGLTFGGEAKPDSMGYLSVHILLASGESVHEGLPGFAANETNPWNDLEMVASDEIFAQVGWVGLSDVNGDGKAELFVAETEINPEPFQFIRAYEFTPSRDVLSPPDSDAVPNSITDTRLKNPVMEPLRGWSDFAVSDSASAKGGFTCRNSADGRPQIIEWGTGEAFGQGFYSTKIVWEADQNGALHYKDEQTFNSADPVPDLGYRPGADCPGLSPFPQKPPS